MIFNGKNWLWNVKFCIFEVHGAMSFHKTYTANFLKPNTGDREFKNLWRKFDQSVKWLPVPVVVLAVRRGVCSRRSLKMNWSFSPCSSLWVMPKVEWWSHFSPRDSNLWKVSLMMISWNCNITLMNEMSNMAAPKAHLSSFSSYFPGNHSRKINKVGSAILNSILMIYSVFLRLFWMSNMAAPKAHLSSSFLGNHSREINIKLVLRNCDCSENVKYWYS